jgi:hypothetical protein
MMFLRRNFYDSRILHLCDAENLFFAISTAETSV